MAYLFGDKAMYTYGASSNEHRNVMPNHLMQWTADPMGEGVRLQVVRLPRRQPAQAARRKTITSPA